MSRRTERLNDLLRDEIAQMLQRDLKDPRLDGWLISVTAVEVSPDLANATVFVSLLGDGDQDIREVEKALASSAQYLRRELGHRLDLRKAPALRFRIDESIARGQKLSRILDDLAREGGPV
jgi:ribosome-binding factor A